jgi:hypothetical protein
MSMGHARPEYAISVAIVGILLAIGIPAVARGQLFFGWLFTGLAIAAALFFLYVLIRERLG